MDKMRTLLGLTIRPPGLMSGKQLSILDGGMLDNDLVESGI